MCDGPLEAFVRPEVASAGATLRKAVHGGEFMAALPGAEVGRALPEGGR